MRKYFLVLPALLAACGATPSPAVNPDPNHTHADFAVVIGGKMWDFAQAKYMSGSSAEKDHSDGHSEFLHLHDGIGTVVHRHQPGLTLLAFLQSLGWQWQGGCFTTDTAEKFCDTATKKWQLFVNGAPHLPFDPAYDFADLDHILLFYGAGEPTPADFARVTDLACVYSKTCPERGEAPPENCVADPSVPCVLPQK